MPKRTDIHTIMIIGAGPIIIGQACEFDYSGTQACKALKEEGYRVVLVNSNPATIMTDPDFADRTYIEPVTPEACERIIALERPDALLPTVGGQTGLNTAMALVKSGVLKRYGVRLIGANEEAIAKAEDRELFKRAMLKIGLDVPKSRTVKTLAQAKAAARELGFPLILRPAFTLGGTGGGVVQTRADFDAKAAYALAMSPVSQVLVEESVLGWKEFELEVMRDRADNVVIVCSIENFDPMGVHTGDSITVAPAQTLTDKEYQRMRDAALAIIREIGVDTGGSNIQFGVDPRSGRLVVIEMNPRVSRSSALASKATGFPIAKIAAKLAVGYTLDELSNDITKGTPASFEPALDYVVVKAPRFTFEKFPEADATLTTQMKSVGEAMAIGRNFAEAFQKSLRSLETGRAGWVGMAPAGKPLKKTQVEEKLRRPNAERVFYIKDAMALGLGDARIHSLSGVDPWFLGRLRELFDAEAEALRAIKARGWKRALDRGRLEGLKRLGFSDRQLADLSGVGEESLRVHRLKLGLKPSFLQVDTCAGEFKAETPYLYSAWESGSDAPPTARKKVVILGGGPNRIGQGIEFDYCCVHAAFALREDGYEVIMVNCNPETVSTDYDTSDRLYFEPLTREDVLNILEREKPWGVVVQFGGQTPLKLSVPLWAKKAPILGTTPDSIDIAEDRERFGALLGRLGIPSPAHGIARSLAQARAVAAEIGYPIMVRPSYVLGGRAMEITQDPEQLERFFVEAARVAPEHPVLLDKYLEDAIEVDVDCVCDGRDVVIAGIMEHIEEAGIHSGDSACVIPPFTLREDQIAAIKDYTVRMALALKVKGLMNVQYAVKAERVYVLEVNPRASRTVPFVSKATGISWAKVAARVMCGRGLRSLKLDLKADYWRTPHHSVKEAVFPFNKFPGADSVLGPEMKSTGEVMGIDMDFGLAFAKSQLAANLKFPLKGSVFFSVKNKDKRQGSLVAGELERLGFKLFATRGTAHALRTRGIKVEVVNKVLESRPTIVDLIKAGKIDLIINTPAGKGALSDDFHIRRAALMGGVSCVTTLSAASETVHGIASMQKAGMRVRALQDYHKGGR
ncbi:MAG TPA: carbamoyl-phosphate synthase large subunit [bacterium]|jgi:carbamoyl-phosphate synthase large subunit|nr:carbamoyl-phosphate synthase large subunit [bacterium]